MTSRAVVPGTRKSRLLLGAVGASLDPTRRAAMPGRAAPPLHAVRHLVDAVVAAPPPDSPESRTYTDGLVWMLGLFERLQRRDHPLGDGRGR